MGAGGCGSQHLKASPSLWWGAAGTRTLTVTVVSEAHGSLLQDRCGGVDRGVRLAAAPPCSLPLYYLPQSLLVAQFGRDLEL